MATASVPAGFPSPANDHLDVSLDLSRRFVRNPTATFQVQVSGESLWGTGFAPLIIAAIFIRVIINPLSKCHILFQVPQPSNIRVVYILSA